MHRNLTVLAGLICCGLVTVASLAYAGHDEKSGQTPADEKAKMEAEMQKYMEIGAPGEHHQHIAKFEGTWNAKAKNWMAPDAPPMESEGKSVNTMMLGGRFLMINYTGTMMNMPFEGIGIEGFDKGGQKHTSYWMDNFGTTVMYMEGTCSKDDMSTNMTGTFKDPVTGQTKAYRTVSRWASPTQVVWEMYEKTPDGKEFKNMEITYTKAGEAQKAGY